MKNSKLDGSFMTVLGVEYRHLHTSSGSDLYLTKYGIPYSGRLVSEKWYTHRTSAYTWEKLRGTGTVYRVHTPRDSWQCDIVVKHSRVGQDVPGRDPEICSDNVLSEFNSPFEEFSLLMEMRDARFESPGIIRTHQPLAIFVPVDRIDPELLGRKQYLFSQKAKEAAVELDLHRQYLVIYQWIKGADAVEACKRGALAESELEPLMQSVQQELNNKGFEDHDRKPHHIIVRIDRDGSVVRSREGIPIHAYIDFEVLRRTPERENIVRNSRRADYLRRQRDRFSSKPGRAFPSHLAPVRIFGVDYVYGRVESTGGALWVVGKDPGLYDYFLPERWRQTPRTKLSRRHQLFYTHTKDNIHLVWTVSRVGEKPDVLGFDARGRSILEHGHNSPFEEFALALELRRKGFPTIYPRAIYRTGTQTTTSEYIADLRRYESHRHILMPDGHAALQPAYNYIVVWGYWNGPDELLAVRDGEYYVGINLAHAREQWNIPEKDFEGLIEREKARLNEAGMEDLTLHGHHLMLSLDQNGNLVIDNDGGPEIRLCNFELVRRYAGPNE
ncbi:MAG: hypothetical protein GF418_02315 [Chitinivibrionales bacterium]|nr:hypothetical protein [Chitinivibrionales bacterium]MBD3394435.1 hypothetical protein [Chitinivibrionales bacterium]